MRYLLNDRYRDEKKIHIIDENCDELESVCGNVSAEDIQRYWTVRDSAPTGQLCSICKSGQSFEKAHEQIEQPVSTCDTCHSTPDFPEGKFEVVCMADMKLSTTGELEKRHLPVISICQNSLIVACPECKLGQWFRNKGYEYYRPTMFKIGACDDKWFADLKAHA